MLEVIVWSGIIIGIIVVAMIAIALALAVIVKIFDWLLG